MSLWAEYGNELYLPLMHANFLNEPAEKQSAFAAHFGRAVASVPPDELRRWLNTSWREQLTAAWIVAARPIPDLRELISDKLLASATCYAGQGLCVATARYQDQRAQSELDAYLRSYLPVGDREYDQEWAIGSLVWLDKRLGTNRAHAFLEATDNWKVISHGQECGIMEPMRGIDRVARAMEFLDTFLAAQDRSPRKKGSGVFDF